METNPRIWPFPPRCGAAYCFAAPTDGAGPTRRRVASAASGRAGSPVSKDALIEAAWPGLAVEDSNLTVQIAALRRVFEEDAGSAGLDRDSAAPRLPLCRPGGRAPEGPVSRRKPADVTAAPGSPTSLRSRCFRSRISAAIREQDYFADGMVEDIITGLSRIKWLFVIARNSSLSYNGEALT